MTLQPDDRKAIDRVLQDASAARAFFHTWNELNLARGKPCLRATMNNYNYVDFFHVSIAGNFKLVFLSLSKLFDKKSRAISLRAVGKIFRDNGYVEVAHEIDKLHETHEDTIKKIRHIRNKSIAHNDPASIGDVIREASITPNAIRELIDVVCLVLNAALRELNYPNLISDGDRNRKAVNSLLIALKGPHASRHDAV